MEGRFLVIAGGVADRAEPGVGEGVGQEADDREQARSSTEDRGAHLALCQLRGDDAEDTVSHEGQDDDQGGGEERVRAGGQEDEDTEEQCGNDRAGRDDARGGTNLFGDATEDGGGQEGDAVGADGRNHRDDGGSQVHDVRHVAGRLVDARVEEIHEEQRRGGEPDDGVDEDLTELLDLEASLGGADLAGELRDEEEGEDRKDHDDAAQDEQQDAHGDDVTLRGEVGDKPGVEEAQDQTGEAVEGVGHANVTRVAVLVGDQAHELVADAPPDEDRGDSHRHEQQANGRQRREHRVPEREERGDAEADPGQRTNADYVGDDTGGQVTHEGRDRVGAQEGAHDRRDVVGGGTTRGNQRLTQRVLEDVLQVDGGVDDGAADGDQNEQEEAVSTREIVRVALLGEHAQHCDHLS